jgi:hypothetical protein
MFLIYKLKIILLTFCNIINKREQKSNFQFIGLKAKMVYIKSEYLLCNLNSSFLEILLIVMMSTKSHIII